MFQIGKILTGVRAASLIINWFDRANDDGRISLKECTDLIVDLAGLFDLPLEIDTPDEMVNAATYAKDTIGVVRLLAE